MQSIAKLISETGYFIGRPILSPTKIKKLRNQLDELFAKNSDPICLDLLDLDLNKDLEQDVVKNFFDLFQDKQVTTIFQEISDLEGVEVSSLPIFQIQKNMTIHPFISPYSGWHPDCGGETNYKYCKERLPKKDYVFGKVAFYLQENSDFGGAIDVIPFSHKKIRSCNIFKSFFPKALLRFLNKIIWRIGQTGNKKFLKKIFRPLETALSLVLGEVCTKPLPGSPVFFDSGLLHRSSPISDSVADQVKHLKDDHFELPNEFTKYALYCHYGSTVAVESYMYDRLRRPGNQHEYERWIKQVKLTESIYPLWAASMHRVITSAKIV